jgi:putative sigma-54 modulation protein
MYIKIHSIHFDTDEKLEKFIHEKMARIERFASKIIGAEVFLKLDHNKSVVKDKIAEIKLKIPGKTLYAEERSMLFEESVELATDSIVRQVKKHKEKIQQE